MSIESKIYELHIKPHNKAVHNDIQHDIQKRSDGIFSFTLKVRKGLITDYVNLEYGKYPKS